MIMSSLTVLSRNIFNCSIRPSNWNSAYRNGFSSSSNFNLGLRGFRQKQNPIKTRSYNTQSKVAAETWEGSTTGTTISRPGTWSGDQIGRAVLAGASLFGVGSLCYYGLGLSNETGAIDRAAFWPTEVHQRIRNTYTSFASGLGVTTVAALFASRSQSVMRFMIARPLMSGITFLVGTIGSCMLCYSIPYSPETLPAKIGAFTLFTSVMGATLAPVALIGGPLVARAALYTAGVVGALSLTAACAPSEKYLYMSGPLSLGLGVVFVASIGGLFARPGTALFSGLHAVYMYGGLALFGAFLLYDTQKIINNAETKAYYDPINMSVGIYLDTINIFIRIFYLLSGSGNRRR